MVGARHGLVMTHEVWRPVTPATRWRRVGSRASASVISGRMVARRRADTALYRGCADVERLIRHYLARSRWVNDRVRQAAVHEAGEVLEVGPGEMVDAIMTRCMQRLWPGEAYW
jgi:hypothetical protein